ncbi:hypothetical protein H0H93_010324, partial [Arthromyces matolae]
MLVVLIGISNYRELEAPNLHPTTNDISLIEALLVESFGAAKNRIIKLLDDQATRENILKVLQGLANAYNDIDSQGPVLIYYAAPENNALSHNTRWPTNPDNRAYMILPRDFELQGLKTAQEQAILDAQLSDCLANIASKRSNNITVIIDCCTGRHDCEISGHEKMYTARGVDVALSHTDPESLVSVALTRPATAGKDNPLRPETHSHGFFTGALSSLIRKNDASMISYDSLVAHLDSLTLHSEDAHSKGGAKPVQYAICILPEKPDTFILQAGLAHGITIDVEFDIYLEKDLTLKAGSVIVRDTGLLESHCTLSSTTPHLPREPRTLYAVQRRVTQQYRLRVWIDPNDPFYYGLKELLGSWRHDPTIGSILLVCSNNAEADLGISSTPTGLVEFE